MIQNSFSFLSENLTVGETAEELGVSLATVQNWIRLGTLASIKIGNKRLIPRKEAQRVRSGIESQSLKKLANRANKKFIKTPRTHRELNTPLLLNFYSDNEAIFPRYSLEQILLQIAQELFFHALRSGKESPDSAALWVAALRDELTDWQAALNHPGPVRLDMTSFGEESDCLGLDLLGATYQHLSKSASKISSGSYYTPIEISAQVINENQKFGDVVFDPACGSGSFLLQSLRKKIRDGEKDPLSTIVGNDIDQIAVRICRINLLIEAKSHYEGTLKVYQRDSISGPPLADDNSAFGRYDFVVTNPPWGSELQTFKSFQKKDIELISDSFAAFLVTALSALRGGGRITVLLPEAFCNVGLHRKIRNKILSETSNISIENRGKIFIGLMTPVIILSAEKTKPTSRSTVLLKTSRGVHYRRQADLLNSAEHSIVFEASDENLALVDKIYSHPHKRIGPESDFALGIVTGDNKRYISADRRIGYEPIIRGRDVAPFQIAPPCAFVKFEKALYQQCADEQIYRSPEKLVYRFIANHLVIALDRERRLTLNSANILIPRNGVPITVVLAILQSDAIQFIFKMKFSTVKILKKHIQELPIFTFSNSIQNELHSLVEDLLLANAEESINLRWRLNRIIYDAIELNESEIEAIKEVIYSNKSSSSS